MLQYAKTRYARGRQHPREVPTTDNYHPDFGTYNPQGKRKLKNGSGSEIIDDLYIELYYKDHKGKARRIKKYYTFCYGALSSAEAAGDSLVRSLEARDEKYGASPQNAGCTDYPVYRELEHELKAGGIMGDVHAAMGVYSRCTVTTYTHTNGQDKPGAPFPNGQHKTRQLISFVVHVAFYRAISSRRSPASGTGKE